MLLLLMSPSLSFPKKAETKISFAPYNAGGQIDILIDNVSACSTALDGETVDDETVSPIK